MGKSLPRGDVERKHIHAPLSDEAKITSLQEAVDQGFDLIPGDATHTGHPLGLSQTGCRAEVRVQSACRCGDQVRKDRSL